MPFKSKAQQRFMFAAEDRGEVPRGTAKRWAEETPNIKKLPEKVKKKRSKVEKKGFEMGVAKKCIEIMEKAAIRYSPAAALKNPQEIPLNYSPAPGGPESFSPDPAIIAKINRFMNTETVESIIEKINRDPKIPSEQKQKLIRDILGWEQQYSGDSGKDTVRIGEATGIAGGLLLAYLMSRNAGIESNWLKALLAGAIILTSGIVGNVVGKTMASSHRPVHPGPISFSKWKGY